MDIAVLVVSDPTDGGRVGAVGAAFTRLLGAAERRLPVGTSAEAILRHLADPAVAVGVLPDGTDVGGIGWEVIEQATKPVVLVGPSARLPHPDITRALLPLDGSEESAQAVEDTARLLDRAGVELVVLHVFDRATVPAFWDQSAHAHAAWVTEFLSRNVTPVGARLELRCGRPGEHVVRSAESEDVDLIALGWSQSMEPGRARTVRECVTQAVVPVLMLPVAGT